MGQVLHGSARTTAAVRRAMCALDMLGFGGHPHHPGGRLGLEDGEKAGAVFRDLIRHLFASMRRTVCLGGRGVKGNLNYSDVGEPDVKGNLKMMRLYW